MDESPQRQYIVEVLVNCVKESNNNVQRKGPYSLSNYRPCQPEEQGEIILAPILLNNLDGISHIRIFLPTKELNSVDTRQTAFRHILEVKKRFANGIALLDPVENMGITDENFQKLLRVRQAKLNEICH